ncbi:hypothetical protein [uncultured Clostridium sp.]|jgi:hypothetical protein|uniref:hypothetical protein n=1 Tax=uncultured Clostridium sp. TaxID=59620 RepID=UPI00260E0C7D|nr:hypothetical protein [uncultured Clostridium sp.]
MKNKKIGIIILGLVLVGGVAGGYSYKSHMKEVKQQELEAQQAQEVKAKEEQVKVQDTKEVEEDKVKVSGLSDKHIAESKVEKEDVINSNFKSKIESYVSEFRKSGDDIQGFIGKLNSIDTKSLNTQEKTLYDNVRRAAGEWSDLNSVYSQIRMAGDGSMEEIVKYNSEDSINESKKVIDKTDVKNIISTGVMSKEAVDKEISFLKEYIENKEQDVKKEKEEELQVKVEHAKLKTTQEKEEFYYNEIKTARQRQMDYINSIKDPNTKQSVQSSMAAAIAKETSLELKYPEDSKIIQASLTKVLEGAKLNN